jgi:hypothetical protein
MRRARSSLYHLWSVEPLVAPTDNRRHRVARGRTLADGLASLAALEDPVSAPLSTLAHQRVGLYGALAFLALGDVTVAWFPWMEIESSFRVMPLSPNALAISALLMPARLSSVTNA